MFGPNLIFLMIVLPTNIAGGKGIEGLLVNMRNAQNQTIAVLLFDANILGSNITEIMRLKNEDPGSYWAEYVVNYVSFLKRVTKVELEEMANLTGITVSYHEYLRQWVISGEDNNKSCGVSSLLCEMRNANGSESASGGV